MPVTTLTPAPYATTSTMVDILYRHRTKGIPSPVTAEVLGRVGVNDSLISRTLQAMQTLDLIDDDGNITETFEKLRLSPESEYRARMIEWLNSAYAEVLSSIDPASASETEIRDAFRGYKPVGQQDRMVLLFVGLYVTAGIRSEREKKRKTNVRTLNSVSVAGSEAKSKTSATKTQLSPVQLRQSEMVNTNITEKSTQKPMSDKALEYKLVDLLKEPDLGDPEKQAVWILVQYLSKKQIKTAT